MAMRPLDRLPSIRAKLGSVIVFAVAVTILILYIAVGFALRRSERDREFLLERSPRTYMQQIKCPLLVIQGKNDPRVIERESRDVVEQLQAAGKQVDYLVFEDEGHDVLKYANRVTCYTAITDFFKKYL